MDSIDELFHVCLLQIDDILNLPEVLRPMNIYSDRVNRLSEALHGLEKDWLIELENAQGEFLGGAALQSFLAGFRIGARLTLDTFVLQPDQIIREN